jgi:hypothetical protein
MPIWRLSESVSCEKYNPGILKIIIVEDTYLFFEVIFLGEVTSW